MPKRIIPVASGKGGVGKTTFAVNFALALSRRAPTILVDLDTGTSSVRSTLAVPVQRDLYHFHRKATPLVDCVTRLDAALDPGKRFGNFGFVAGPRHFIEELANPDAEFRRRLSPRSTRCPPTTSWSTCAPASTPTSSTSCPTPTRACWSSRRSMPTATLAASDIVKAILFRTLRLVFRRARRSSRLPGISDGHDLVNELLDGTEDVYDESMPNLDCAAARTCATSSGDSRSSTSSPTSSRTSASTTCSTCSTGSQEGYERTLKPFVENVAQNVSARPTLTQLGWVVDDDRIHQANCSGRPILLERRQARKRVPAEPDPVMAELEALRLVDARHRAPAPEAAPVRAARRRGPPRGTRRSMPAQLLDAQLSSLKAMYSDRSQDTVPGELLLPGVPRAQSDRAAARAERVRA